MSSDASELMRMHMNAWAGVGLDVMRSTSAPTSVAHNAGALARMECVTHGAAESVETVGNCNFRSHDSADGGSLKLPKSRRQ